MTENRRSGQWNCLVEWEVTIPGGYKLLRPVLGGAGVRHRSTHEYCDQLRLDQ